MDSLRFCIDISKFGIATIKLPYSSPSVIFDWSVVQSRGFVVTVQINARAILTWMATLLPEEALLEILLCLDFKDITNCRAVRLPHSGCAQRPS